MYQNKLIKLDTVVHLNDDERQLQLQELCSVLQRFQDLTSMIQNEGTVSTNFAIPLTMGLQHQMKDISNI